MRVRACAGLLSTNDSMQTQSHIHSTNTITQFQTQGESELVVDDVLHKVRGGWSRQSTRPCIWRVYV